MSSTPLGVVKPWKSQYGKPEEGTCTPHWVTLPAASRLVSFCAYSCISFQFAGGLFGSRPASLKSSLFQYRTIVERWNGRPHVLPSVWLLARKALKKGAASRLSKGTI